MKRPGSARRIPDPSPARKEAVNFRNNSTSIWDIFGGSSDFSSMNFKTGRRLYGFHNPEAIQNQIPHSPYKVDQSFPGDWEMDAIDKVFEEVKDIKNELRK